MPYTLVTTVIIILLAATTGTYAAFAISLRRWRRARDLTVDALEGTRFERYAERIRKDVLELRALPWEDVYIRSSDSLRLHGRMISGSGTAVILVHGYRSSVENDFAGIARWYAARGCTVLAIDQRANGLSGGRHMTMGVRERRDVIAWAQFAQSKLGAERIVLHGVSMGAVSVLFAMGAGLPERVTGCVADCPFDRLSELFAWRVRKRLHVPAYFLLRPFVEVAWRIYAGASPDECCHESAASSELPLLLIEAGDDATVPRGSAERIWSVRGGRDTLLRIEHAQHALCWQEDAERYSAVLGEFLDRILAPAVDGSRE